METFAITIYVIAEEVLRILRVQTENGFLIKIFCFILSYSASFIWKGSLA
jgi:hypothetical protein